MLQSLKIRRQLLLVGLICYCIVFAALGIQTVLFVSFFLQHLSLCSAGRRLRNAPTRSQHVSNIITKTLYCTITYFVESFLFRNSLIYISVRTSLGDRQREWSALAKHKRRQSTIQGDIRVRRLPWKYAIYAHLVGAVSCNYIVYIFRLYKDKVYKYLANSLDIILLPNNPLHFCSSLNG